jgi:hypothetical protein
MWKSLAGFAVGCVVGAIGVRLWASTSTRSDGLGTVAVEAAAPGAVDLHPASAWNAEARPVVASDVPREHLASSPGSATPVASGPTQAMQQMETPAPTTRAQLQLPGGKLESIDGPQTQKLLDAFRVDCLFGPGAGGQWPKGTLFPHGAQWQGGLITYDTLNLAENTARLKANAGLTRTEDGELDVRAIATDTGLHFTAINADGELMMTTVFAALDAAGKFRAVVSFHGPNMDNESAQFYGGCTT